MPVPKRKTSKSRRDKRSSTKFIRAKAFTRCKNCDSAINPHQACTQCGFYKGKKVLTTKLERALRRNEEKKAQQAQRAMQVQEQKEAPVEVEEVAKKENEE